jgi:diguanylate cyclase (GGDEF)-like protein
VAAEDMAIRTKAIPALVILLSLAAIGASTLLQSRADAGRDAQLKLAKLQTELRQLQNAPFRASPRNGGSPVVAGELMADSKRRVAATLDELNRSSPAPALARIPGPLRANYASLDEIFAIGASGAEYGRSADQLAGKASKDMEIIAAALDEAGDEYDSRASATLFQSRTGTKLAILLLALAFAFFYRRAAMLGAANHKEARSDSLTGLPNRRALVEKLAADLPHAGSERQVALALFDLDGFKQYNDTFGHPAGDALLTRLGERLTTALDGIGVAYRMGGDEFCILAPVEPAGASAVVALAAEALSEAGDAFDIGCSYGTVLVPSEAASPADALRLADQRMYEEKAGRSSASRQSTDVLLKVLSERSSELREHLSGVAALAEQTAERLGRPAHEVRLIALAAELHDVGKTAIPDAILNKPGPLDDDEWEFMRRHTVIGERIILAAPSLAPSAALVRSSHERFDGTGYPDALRGDTIPLGASIIAVCDAYDAMVSERPYRAAMPIRGALAELRRCAGTQFDPHVVDAFSALVAERDSAPLAA